MSEPSRGSPKEPPGLCPLSKQMARSRRNKLERNRAQGVQRLSWVPRWTRRCQCGATGHGRRGAALSRFQPVCRCAGKAQTPGTKPSGRIPRSGSKGQARARTGTLSQVPGGGEESQAALRLVPPPSSSPSQAPGEAAAKSWRREIPVPPARRAEAGRSSGRDAGCGPGPPRLPELSVVLRTGGAAAAPRRCPRGCRGRSHPAACGALSGTGRALTPGHPAGCRGLSRTDSPATASRTISMLSAPPARSFPAGACISRCSRLREPVPFVQQEFGWLFTTTSRAESRSWPRQGQRLERDGDCGNSAAPHQVWGGGGESTVRERKEEKIRPARPGRQRSPAPFTAPERAAGGSPTHPGRAPGSLSCRSAP